MRQTLSIIAALFCLIGCTKQDPQNAAQAPQEKANYAELYQKEIEHASELAKSPDRQLEGLVQLALLYHANGEQSEAIKCYEELCDRDAKDPRWPYLLANLIGGYGQLEKAVSLLEKAAELAPDTLAVHLRLGETYLKSGQYEKAEQAYKTALGIAPDNTYALLGLARCDIKKEQWTAAQERLERSVYIDPTFYGGWTLLITVLEHTKQEQLAAMARTKLVGRYMDFPDPWLAEVFDNSFDPYRLSVLAATTRDPNESIKRLKRAIELDPYSSTYLRQLGNLLQKQGKIEEAQTQFENAVALDPTDSESWAALIHLLMNAQNYQAMVAAIEEGLSQCPESGYLHFANAKRFAMIGLYPKAIEEFEEAKRIQPSEARSYVQLSIMHLMIGNLQAAKKEALQARTVEPTNPDPIVMLAKVALAGGKRTETREWIKTLRSMPNYSPEDLRILTSEFEKTFRQKL